MGQPLRIALVAGEQSGDILGGGLMHELKKLHPGVNFVGVGGDLMQGQGLQSLYDMDRLSVMGLWEPLKRLPELLSMRRNLIKQFSQYPVDLFIGIDSPDFNLTIAGALKSRGIATAHYVSPSVWAWRQGRVKHIRESLDLMLTLLPFEAEFYRLHQVPVEFVGHPLASQIQPQADAALAKQQLGYAAGPLLLLLPGSRRAEIKHLMPVFAEAAERLCALMPGLQVVVAAANRQCYEQIQQLLSSGTSISLVRGKARELMAASDAVLAASGTTTLEVMLSGRPMVIAYKADALSYAVISRMLKVQSVGLPNLIAGETLVPELIQGQATAANLTRALQQCFSDTEGVRALCQHFARLAEGLRKPSSQLAAQAVSRLLPVHD